MWALNQSSKYMGFPAITWFNPKAYPLIWVVAFKGCSSGQTAVHPLGVLRSVYERLVAPLLQTFSNMSDGNKFG